METQTDRYQQGVAALKKLTGRDQPPPPRRPEDPPNAEDLGRLFVEHCYADSWARPGLDMRTKSMATIAVLTTLGARNELRTHIRGAHHIGISKEEIAELLIHLAAYCGVPRVVAAREAAREVWRAMDGGTPG